ncbi:hypothetical protein BDN70DRAFT_966353 [Pholiota conissans]|uniref:F-box domain-containing protein n=1 Tax=Pholiota conissans TaxID=109636 RepID=A0A9P6CX96_9AGAR|nr:hypothetical protein BDN70DRAFT_966353 [Pholiota conissans]
MPPEIRAQPESSVSFVLPPTVVSETMVENTFSQHNPVRRSILKPPTFRFHFLIPPDTGSITPLPKDLTNRIPLEILHHCIDFLHYDKDTLRSCALVCKSWQARARPLLLPKKLTLVIRNQTGGEIFSMIAAPGSGLANFVHTLSIQSTAIFNIHPPQHTDTEPTFPTISFNEYLLPFVGNCHALRTLIFQGIQIPPRPSKNTSAIPSQIKVFPHLTRLELTRCAFWTFEELLLVICARRSLQELFLTDISVLKWLPDQPPPESLHLPRRLHTLHMNTPGQTLLLTWILSRPFVPPLKAVSLGGVKGTKDQKVIGLFLKALGPNLEQLKLNLVRATHEVNLAHNTALQSLSISHYLIGKVASENISPTGGLVKILRQITSTKVTKIDLHFVNAPQDLMLMPWSAVAEELNAPKFSGLKTVRLGLAGKKSRWEDGFRMVFPRLSANRILKILWDSSA